MVEQQFRMAESGGQQTSTSCAGSSMAERGAGRAAGFPGEEIPLAGAIW